MQWGQAVRKDGHGQTKVVEREVREDTEERRRRVFDVAGCRERERWEDDEERDGNAHRREVDTFEYGMGDLKQSQCIFVDFMMLMRRTHEG